MIPFPVRPEKQKDLEDRMAKLGIREEDLEEHFVRSSGRGGQKVNKTSTCVVLHHKPTGLRFKVQEGRSQGLNRYWARRRLVERLESLEREAMTREAAERARIRKQKARRARRARERIRAEKERKAILKEGRRPMRVDEDFEA